jgi:trk system potassium uptake protein TrkH
MILISYFWTIRNKRIKMSDIILVDASISDDSFGKIKEHSIFIGKFMLRVQLIGILLLAIKFVPMLGFAKGIWYSIFHTISAFSNTGFDLFGENSLTVFSNDAYVQIILIMLMFIGSIGILVIEDIKNNKSRKFYRLKLQTKIILIASLFIILVTTMLFKIFEPNISILNSLFTSITARSTGFQIASVKEFCLDSKIILVILMLIGGSPTSTGGGIRITTITIVFATVISTLRGKNETIIFNRKISDSIIKKAFTILIIFMMVLIIGAIVFYNFNDVGALNVLFECSSAMSNTGLTITDYNSFNLVGEIDLMILMFIGRVSPLSMVLIFVNEDRKNKYIEYPSENIVL